MEHSRGDEESYSCTTGSMYISGRVDTEDVDDAKNV